jgi:hypothetical protein
VEFDERIVVPVVEQKEQQEFGVEIVELVDAAVTFPHLWAVVREKIIAGDIPLTAIAQRMQLASKQIAHYRIVAFVRRCQFLFDALVFDRRWQHHQPAAAYFKKMPAEYKKTIAQILRKYCKTKHKKQKEKTPSLPGM